MKFKLNLLSLLLCILYSELYIWKVEGEALCDTGNQLRQMNNAAMQIEFMSRIEYYTSSGWRQLNCSAVFVAKEWLLAPASCFTEPDKPINYIVRLWNGQAIPVNQIIPNEKYNKELSAGYDFAIVHINLSNNVGCIVALDTPQNNLQQLTCKLIRSEDSTGHLMSNEYFVQNIKIKANTSECSHSDRVDHSLVFCAGENGVSVCPGESGSIVLCSTEQSNTNASQFHLIGLASWGNQFCKNSPYLFTSLLPHYKWIHSYISS